ncbi:MAG: ABC transporter permease [Rhodoblastus sp.]
MSAKLGRARRIRALIVKESLQVARDPSSFVVAVILPALLLFLFGFGISFDTARLKIGLVLEDQTPVARDFATALTNTRYFSVRVAQDRRAFIDDLSAGSINAIVTLSGDFANRLARGDTAAIQVVSDGSDPNTASMTAGYVQGAWRIWQAQRAAGATPGAGGVDVEPRFWFNPELESRRALVPGSISLIQMLIGALLTALVVSREWERGTIEALLATPVGVFEFIIGKLVPNFALGMIAMAVCLLASIFVFHIPLRGSLLALMALTALFLTVALGLGLFISTVARTQFLASQLATLVAFLPGLYFSGFMFEIAAMPAPLRWFSVVVPAKYYVTGLQTIFLAGDIPAVLLPAGGALALMAVIIFAFTARNTKQKLD